MNSILNISFYMFTPLENLEEYCNKYRAHCRSLSIIGTIIFSSEGINGSLAGEPEAVQEIKRIILAEKVFKDIEFKESYSSIVPFKKLIVKIRPTLLSFNANDIHPEKETGNYITPKELKHWLDTKKDFILLDTRNTYEIQFGTFEKAQTLPLRHFRHFPKQLDALKDELKNKTVVMFCTGGIRCEKATAYAKKIGLNDVYQLKGGILKYFEECGGAHYQGKCFVFDDRITVNSLLEETKKTND